MRSPVFVNKSPHGRLSVIIMGVCHVVDGLIRVFSLGTLSTNLPLEFARISAKRHFEKLRKEAAE